MWIQHKDGELPRENCYADWNKNIPISESTNAKVNESEFWDKLALVSSIYAIFDC